MHLSFPFISPRAGTGHAAVAQCNTCFESSQAATSHHPRVKRGVQGCGSVVRVNKFSTGKRKCRLKPAALLWLVQQTNVFKNYGERKKNVYSSELQSKKEYKYIYSDILLDDV